MTTLEQLMEEEVGVVVVSFLSEILLGNTAEQLDPSSEELDYDRLQALIDHHWNYSPFASPKNDDVSELDLTLVLLWLSWVSRVGVAVHLDRYS